MRYVLASYVYTQEFNQPLAWLKRINAYSGILDALAENNEVISIEQIDYEGQLTHNGVKYHFCRYPATALRYFPWRLHRFIKSLKPDVVVIQGLLFPLQIIQLRLMLGRDVKIIVQNHAEKPFVGLKKTLQQVADWAVDAYLFASHQMGLDWVIAGNLASPQKIHEVMEVSSVFYPVNAGLAKLKTGITGQPVFLWVGRLNANKDPLNVIRAFLKFAEQLPAAKLYMIYHTEELLPEIYGLLSIHPQKNAITLIGKIPHASLLYWFNSADFIISGSHYEGSGTAICEAMSCGCVPLVTDILSFRMITNNGACGTLYQSGNEAALLEALINTQQMNIEQKRQLSLAHYKKHLSFEAIATRIQEIAEYL